MMVVGLTGSIAMGKSAVAKIFKDHDIPVFDADREVHALYDSPEGADLLRAFAPSAISEKGVNRQELSQLVLTNRGMLEKLEGLVHAEIAVRRRAFLDEATRRGSNLVVIDIPLLFEKGAEKDMDKTIVITATPENQRARALARPGMTEEKLKLILARQMPDPEKQLRADIVVSNNGSLEALRIVVEAIIDQLRSEARHHA